jgi:hypothetical protein
MFQCELLIYLYSLCVRVIKRLRDGNVIAARTESVCILMSHLSCLADSKVRGKVTHAAALARFQEHTSTRASAARKVEVALVGRKTWRWKNWGNSAHKKSQPPYGRLFPFSETDFLPAATAISTKRFFFIFFVGAYATKSCVLCVCKEFLVPTF